MMEGNNRSIKVGRYLYILRLGIGKDTCDMASCYNMDENDYVEVDQGKRDLSLEETVNIASFLISLLYEDRKINRFTSNVREYIDLVIYNLLYYYVDVSSYFVDCLSENIDYHFDVTSIDSLSISGMTFDREKTKELVKC